MKHSEEQHMKETQQFTEDFYMQHQQYKESMLIKKSSVAELESQQ